MIETFHRNWKQKQKNRTEQNKNKTEKNIAAYTELNLLQKEKP